MSIFDGKLDVMYREKKELVCFDILKWFMEILEQGASVKRIELKPRFSAIFSGFLYNTFLNYLAISLFWRGQS